MRSSVLRLTWEDSGPKQALNSKSLRCRSGGDTVMAPGRGNARTDASVLGRAPAHHPDVAPQHLQLLVHLHVRNRPHGLDTHKTQKRACTE